MGTIWSCVSPCCMFCAIDVDSSWLTLGFTQVSKFHCLHHLNRLKKQSDPPKIASFIKIVNNTFVELIIIHKLLFCDDRPSTIQNIQTLACLPCQTKQTQSECESILYLLKQYNIHGYMRNYYHDSQCDTIDLIFYEIIVKHHGNDYYNLISMSSNININQFECQVFNQHDLVPEIFQYLDLKSLNNCSLVNFIWLYHSFNINSLYCLPINELLIHNHRYYGWLRFDNDDNCKKQIKPTAKNAALRLTVWQRFVNVKHLVVYFGYINWNDLRSKYRFKQFLRYYLYFQKVEKIIFYNYPHWNWNLGNQCSLFLESLCMNNRGAKITNLKCHASRVLSHGHSEYRYVEEFPVLIVSNVESISLDVFPAAFICSNKCKYLSLRNISFTEQLYDCMVNECDLSGIVELYISNLSIYSGINIRLIANQFVNIRKLSIDKVGKYTLIFVEALMPILVKNNCQISMKLEPEPECVRMNNYGRKWYETQLVIMPNYHDELTHLVMKNRLNIVNLWISLQKESYMLVEKLFASGSHVNDTLEMLTCELWDSRSPSRWASISKKNKHCYSNDILRKPFEVMVDEFMIPRIQSNSCSTLCTDTNINTRPNEVLLTHTDHYANKLIFTKLNQISCKMDISGGLACTDLRALIKFLKLRFKSNACTKDNLPFWQICITVRWPYDIAKSAFSVKNIDKYQPQTAGAYGRVIPDLNQHERKDLELEFIQESNQCMKRLFQVIKYLFIESQVPLDFSMKITQNCSRKWKLTPNTQVHWLKEVYAKYYKESFDSQFDTFINGYDSQYIPVWSNGRCVALKTPKINTEITKRYVKFVVKTAVLRDMNTGECFLTTLN